MLPPRVESGPPLPARVYPILPLFIALAFLCDMHAMFFLGPSHEWYRDPPRGYG